MDQSKLISIKEETSGQITDTSETVICQDFCDQFGFIRKVKGDGNCFYRALCFALIETLLQNKSSLQSFRDKLVRGHETLITAGFDECTFKECLNTFLSVMDQLEADGCEDTLLKLFNDDKGTSDSMVKYLRLLTSAHLQNHADFFYSFVEAPSLKDYCTQEVEAMAMECGHVEILALAEELDVSLCIISIKGSGLTYSTIPEGSQPSLYLLYKMSHYDILYKHEEL